LFRLGEIYTGAKKTEGRRDGGTEGLRDVKPLHLCAISNIDYSGLNRRNEDEGKKWRNCKCVKVAEESEDPSLATFAKATVTKALGKTWRLEDTRENCYSIDFKISIIFSFSPGK
jgi:hypothetical protein